MEKIAREFRTVVTYDIGEGFVYEICYMKAGTVEFAEGYVYNDNQMDKMLVNEVVLSDENISIDQAIDDMFDDFKRQIPLAIAKYARIFA